MQNRRDFLAAAGALSLGAALPGLARAQSGEAFVFLTPFGFIADFIEIMNAHSGGHWRKVGLDSKVIGAQGTSQAIQQLAAGQVPIIRAGTIEFMRAVGQQNLPLLAVATIYQGSTFFVISDEAKPLRTVEDLRGKTMGIVSVGGATEIFLDLMCAKAGIPKTEVKRQVVGNNPAALGLVRQGRIDGFIASSGVVAALRAAKEKALTWSTDRYAPMPSQVYAVQQETAQKRPDLVVKVLRGIKASVDEIVAGPIEPLLVRAAKDFDIPGRRNMAGLIATVEFAKEMYFSQGKQNLMRNVPALWRDGAEVMTKAGYGALEANVEKLYTNQFLDRALSA